MVTLLLRILCLSIIKSHFYCSNDCGKFPWETFIFGLIIERKNKYLILAPTKVTLASMCLFFARFIKVSKAITCVSKPIILC